MAVYKTLWYSGHCEKIHFLMRDLKLHKDRETLKRIHGKVWSAIQVATAAGFCAIIDLVLNRTERYQGFVTQESFPLEDFLENRFGRYYR